MANYANLLATIATNIYQNGRGEVTAEMVKTAMDAAVASLGAGYQFMGIATPSTNPGTPDQNVFYLASTAGIYANFNNIEVYDSDVCCVLKWDGNWSKQVIDFPVYIKENEIMFSIGNELYDIFQIDGAGEIKTRAFNSKDVPSIVNIGKLFEIADENGSVILRITDNGDILTKSFNSKDVVKYVDIFRGKSLSVMGDSISSYVGISPSGAGFSAFYPRGDVQDRKYMWWQIVADSLGMQICKIQANSGSCVTDGVVSQICCASDQRTAELHDGDLQPDIIICECGLNDFYNNAPFGDWDGNTILPNTIMSFREAYGNMLKKIQTNYPMAKIYCCIPAINWHSGYQSDIIPINSAGISFQIYINAIKQIAQIFGCGIIPLNECGINLRNATNFIVDAPSTALFHPNIKGMELYAKQVIKSITLK